MVTNSANVQLLRKLDELDGQYESLGQDLASPEVIADHRRVRELSIKRAAIEPVVTEYRSYLAEMKLQEPLINDLRRRHRAGETLTPLCACHDPARCYRAVLASLILEQAP